MATERKQINVRVDAEIEGLIARLLPAMSAALGIKVTATDLVRLGVLELAKKYLPAAEPEKPKGGKK